VPVSVSVEERLRRSERVIRQLRMYPRRGFVMTGMLVKVEIDAD
jgi:acetolactate synthase regulatory subunit